MLDVLNAILCAIVALAAAIIDTLVLSLNGLILLIGVTLVALVALLPPFPDPPSPPSSGILAALNWIVPLGPLLTGAAVLLALWAAFLSLRVALRWFKAL